VLRFVHLDWETCRSPTEDGNLSWWFLFVHGAVDEKERGWEEEVAKCLQNLVKWFLHLTGERGLMVRLKYMMQYQSTKRVAKVCPSWLRNMSFSNGGWEFIMVVLVCSWCGWERKRVGGGGGEMLAESSEMVSPSNWLRWFHSFFKFCSFFVWVFLVVELWELDFRAWTNLIV